MIFDLFENRPIIVLKLRSQLVIREYHKCESFIIKSLTRFEKNALKQLAISWRCYSNRCRLEIGETLFTFHKLGVA